MVLGGVAKYSLLHKVFLQIALPYIYVCETSEGYQSIRFTETN